MTDLQTSLRRVADAVEPLPVDDDLWQRGVAARRRGQAALVAAAIALVVSVAGTATLLGGEDREARTASSDVVEGGAIPRRIEDIDPDLDPTSDLDVGRASVAFVSATEDPVVITANDGVPHRLALPGWDPSWIALALSPDGRTLAYQQAAGSGTQVSLVDLETGRRTTLLLQAEDQLTINTLSWSPGGDWLAWAASRVADTPSWAGRVRPDGAEARRIVPSSNVVSVAVADDGDAVLGRVRGGLMAWPFEGDTEPIPTDAGLAPGVFSPDDDHVALASAPGTASWTLTTSTGEVRSHPFPEDTLGQAVVRPVGWLDEQLQLLLVQELDGAGGELVVTTPQVGATSTWRRSVGSVDPAITSSVSLAVDLVPDLDGTSSQQLTHDFPVPAERDISWMIGLGVAAAIAVLMALRWLWRRLREM